MSELSTPAIATTDVRVYRTPQGEVLVFTGDNHVVMNIDGTDRLAAVTENTSGVAMQVHVPALSIIGARLHKATAIDAYVLYDVDNQFPGLSERRFVRTPETTYTGDYEPLPDFVPTAAILVRVPGVPTDSILALYELNSATWHIYPLMGDPFGPTGASGLEENIGRESFDGYSEIGTRGVTFRLFCKDYYFKRAMFMSAPEYTCDGRPMDYCETDQLRIEVTPSDLAATEVLLSPLAPASQS